jgi:hypothetical protein
MGKPVKESDRIVVRVGVNPPVVGLVMPNRGTYFVWGADAAMQLAVDLCDAVQILERDATPADKRRARVDFLERESIAHREELRIQAELLLRELDEWKRGREEGGA